MSGHRILSRAFEVRGNWLALKAMIALLANVALVLECLARTTHIIDSEPQQVPLALVASDIDPRFLATSILCIWSKCPCGRDLQYPDQPICRYQ